MKRTDTARKKKKQLRAVLAPSRNEAFALSLLAGAAIMQQH